VKKHLRRRFKSTIHQMFASEQTWALHEPAIGGLLGSLSLGEDLDKPQIAAALNMASADPPGGMQIVGNVAVLGIFGVLSQKSNWITRALGWTTTEQLERDFKQALVDPNVKSIVFLVDSPGGSAIGNEEVAKTIFDARGTKPSYAFVRGIMASAAYYLASAAGAVYASPSSTIGSIGAVSTHIEYSKALAAEGIGATVIRSAPNKQLWNQFEPLSPAAKASLQAWVDSYGNQFEQAVARNRGISQADVKQKFGQGDAFLAPAALSRGMIDGISTLDELLAKASAASSAQSVAAQSATLIANDRLGDLVQANASGSSAAASAASLIPAAVGQSAAKVTIMKISARVRAALFARGLISAQDADGAVCLAALGAYFAARGEACPQKNDELDDDKVVSALFAVTPTAAAATPNPATPPAQPQNTATQASATPAVDLTAERTAAATGERNRQREIRAAAKLLGIPEASIDAAIDSGKPHAEIVAGWTSEVAKRDKPITQTGDVTVTGDGHQRFVSDAVLAVQHRLNRVGAADRSNVNDSVRQLSNAPLSYFAMQCLQAAGAKLPPFMAPEQLMEAAFAMDGAGRFDVGANYVPYNRPGSFPNLLSALANKILDTMLELNEPTYEEWTGVWPGDLPDFKPAPVVNKGHHDEMDEILDAEASKEFGLDEEMLAYMVLRRYSNKFILTPVMAANDDLGAFDEGLLGLESAWQNTVNRACLRLITGNVAMLDGNNLYDNTNHGNDIAGGGGGGVPSDAQWDGMNLKVAAQTGVGGKGYIRTLLNVALVAPKVFRVATQAFAKYAEIGESKVATQDSNVNIYRGRITVVREPELQAYSNDVWYGFARPRGMLNATVVRAYFRGWGKNGRRQRWYDPDTKCWNFELEGRVGAAAKQYRLSVRNNGVS
jgi:signal peptide peptidase SppA